jgi:hypothetical protein
LAYHTLYSLREAYGSERFSIMMAALLDAHEKTMRTNRQSMSAIAHEDEAGHEAEGVGVQRLVQRLETLRLREQVQTALREEVIALVGYDMRPETAKAVDISGSTTAR